jgi:hypothetical protein
MVTLTSALAHITDLPRTAARRREQIKLQVELANALMHTKGYGAPETKVSFDQARSLIERAEALGESLEARCCCSRSSAAPGQRAT